MDAAKDFLTLVGHRYSCREFYDKQLADEELNVILEAVRKSPSARNLQPTRICVVQSPEGLAKIDECTHCRYGAPTVLIAAYDHDVSSHPTPDHGPETSDFGDIDTTIALTNIDDGGGEPGARRLLGGGVRSAQGARAVERARELPPGRVVHGGASQGRSRPDARAAPRARRDRLPRDVLIGNDAETEENPP